MSNSAPNALNNSKAAKVLMVASIILMVLMVATGLNKPMLVMGAFSVAMYLLSKHYRKQVTYAETL